MPRTVKIVALVSASVIALGILGAACEGGAEQQPRADVAQPTTQPAPAPKDTPVPTPDPEPEAPLESVAEANARDKAESYLDLSAFSRSGLIKQLEFEGFTKADATYGVDAVSANWNEQAAKKAAEYLELSSFSRSGLINQLKYEGFTPAQTEYGVSQTGL